eukprot:TRINITY_DN4159_c0_g1_i1.p1 TRINITY_DN4159_c0_g1~~TRINITY_DN4159_c0_g1_i1.p1  ORF type:complete len:590 (+),score=242.60 TRINITY_DN4159_c0_g1_i1:54-1823(+)
MPEGEALAALCKSVLGATWEASRNVVMTNTKQWVSGLLYLLLVTSFLYDAHFHDYTSEEELKSVTCSDIDYLYRTADGTCNHRVFTKMGAAGMRFGRNSQSNFVKSQPPNDTLYTPRPEDAATLLTNVRGQTMDEDLNVLFAAWGQFMAHDWFNHEADVASNDVHWLRTRYPERNQGTHFRVLPEVRDAEGYLRNTATHWWDLSQLYGSNKAKQQELRTMADGRMKVLPNGLLPTVPLLNVASIGAVGNVWAGIEVLHTLFVAEHNWICSELKQRNPTWDDERLFQTARVINTAQVAVVHTEEWLAMLMGDNKPIASALKLGVRGAEGFHTSFWSDPLANLATSVLSSLGLGSGFGGKTTLPAGVAFSQTEDYQAVHRMHSVLPNIVRINGTVLSLLELVGAPGRDSIESHGMEEMMRALLESKSAKLELRNFPTAMSSNAAQVDLAALDIFRERQRGLPRYNELRSQLGLKRCTSFEDINADPAIVADLKSVYSSVDDVDIQVGVLAENPRPHGLRVGETSLHLFLAEAHRRIQTDRFFQESFNEEVYTTWGLQHVLKARLRDIISRHYPGTVSALRDGTASSFLYRK